MTPHPVAQRLYRAAADIGTTRKEVVRDARGAITSIEEHRPDSERVIRETVAYVRGLRRINVDYDQAVQLLDAGSQFASAVASVRPAQRQPLQTLARALEDTRDLVCDGGVTPRAAYVSWILGLDG